LFASQDAEGLKPFTAALFVSFAALATAQYFWFRSQSRKSLPGDEAVSVRAA
jgi:hypothetical protein